MRFPYTPEVRGGETRWLPYVPVTVHGGNKAFTVDALVDSGSEQNVFSTEVAHALGLSLTTERPVQLQGIGGIADGILTVLEFHLGRVRWTAPVIFTKAVGNRGILGQAGFFAFFTVTFRYQGRAIDITRARSRIA